MSKANQIIMEKDITEDLVHEIGNMERENFHEVFHICHEEMRDTLIQPSAINIIAYDEEEHIAGYLLVVDFSEEYDDLRNDADPLIENIPDALYLHSIVVRHDMRGKGIFGKLIKTFREKYPDKIVALHAHANNPSSVGFQKYGAKFIRRVENWYGTGEAYDYLLFYPEKSAPNTP
jgi:GNAT superfamily N-acetyltransferase